MQLGSIGGLWLGVELVDPVGKNNGSLEGTQYFSCINNHGLFVKPNNAFKHGRPCSELLA